MTHIETYYQGQHGGEICPQCNTYRVRYFIDGHAMCGTCALLTVKHRHENDNIKKIESDLIESDLIANS